MATMTEAQMRALARQSAAQNGLDPVWFEAQLAQESRYNPNAVSKKGAEGVAQFMPDTAKWLRVKNPRDPAEAIPAAAKYMAYLNKKFGGDENLARLAYNWGEGNVAKYLKNPDKVTLPKEAASYNAAIAQRAGLAPQYPEPRAVRQAAVPKGKDADRIALEMASMEIEQGLPPGALLAQAAPQPAPALAPEAPPGDWLQQLQALTANAPAMKQQAPEQDVLAQLESQAMADQERVLSNAFGDKALPDLPGLGNVPMAVDRYLDKLLAS